jgi:hypothetical protein
MLVHDGEDALATTLPREKEHLQALSALTLHPAGSADAVAYVAALDQPGRLDLLNLAGSHHVVVRALTSLQRHANSTPEFEAWLAACLQSEGERIRNALRHLDLITRELEAAGCPVTVMKSLDHWPDLGDDLDLFSSAAEKQILHVLAAGLGARVEARSWGDRLAHKWNFAFPTLRESVEVHSQRLGQTGEHIALARRFITRRVARQIGGYTFLVPAPEERILVATLQRMYRHFYFRICDIVNSAALVESGELDYAELRRASEIGGIWPGVATYLKIVSDYVQQYCGHGLELPSELLNAAQFGGERLFVLRRFLRVPIVPEGARLYAKQLKATVLRGDMPACFRLSLLPPLASAAAIAFKITGDDKGIW